MVEDVWTTGGGALEYTLAGFMRSTQYDVQVRAVNEAGDGPWSATVTGTPTTSVCVSGGAVADATNTGLISDCVALLGARDILAGTATLNWSADTPIGRWDGVSYQRIRPEGTPLRVTELLLNSRSLTGRIPSELGNLSNLTTMSLGGNQLTGEIPTALGNLSNLRDLTLSSNQLTGEIPAELGNLSNLSGLFLFSNQLTGEIPTELGNLSSLQTLWLNNNQLTGELPQTLTGLTALASFTFGYNAGLCAPTDEAFQAWLQSVASVSGDNCVAEDEDSAEDRAVLVELYNATDGANWRTNTNWLSDEPMREWHGVVTDDEGRVAELSLDDNQLTGEIPTELGNLSNLQRLYLPRNQLTGEIPTELGNLSNLRTLILSINQLSGEIPTELGNLSNLQTLWLVTNQLTGKIPTELGNLSNLTGLSLSGNHQLTGEIPTELGNLSNLRTLILNRNQLTGEIPTELGNLSNLKDLILNGNQLTGEIPTELGNLSRLTRLSLHENQLTGEIPTELGNLSNLRTLILSSNQLTGELPQSLTGLMVLRSLYFDNNAGLCAPIEEAFQTWLKSVSLVSGSSCAPMDSAEDRAVLVELYNATDGANWTNNTKWLSDRPIREWHGVINDADGRVSDLSLLRNELTGEIPTELGSLSNLKNLYLHANQLTGEIPTGTGRPLQPAKAVPQ